MEPEADALILLAKYRSPAGKEMDAVPSYFEFEVSIKGLKPGIWRRFLIRQTATFSELHTAIQDAFLYRS